MGPIQQSLNSIATTAMDAVRTKEALASQHDRDIRDKAEKDFNARVKQQEEDYVSGKIGREKLDPDVDSALFGSREQTLNQRRFTERLAKYKGAVETEFFKKMSPAEKDMYLDKLRKRVGDRIFFKGSDRYNSQQSYQLSRIFDTMQDMVKGNRYAQQAAIQLSDKIDTALNHMQSRKRWR